MYHEVHAAFLRGKSFLTCSFFVVARMNSVSACEYAHVGCLFLNKQVCSSVYTEDTGL